VLNRIIVVLLTRTVRGVPTQITELIAILDPARRHEICVALAARASC
jgi:hypothetical protein